MKVLLDENLSLEFVTKFKALLEPEGSAIHRVVDEGWMGYENGMLMSAMETAGFTHMVTYDKKMSSQTIPTVAVLLVDPRRVRPTRSPKRGTSPMPTPRRNG